MNERRWDALMAALSLPPSKDTFRRLCLAYGERHRAFHTAGHINDCLVRLDACRNLAQQPWEVEMALWFQDAVYKPYRHDNETRSAGWARGFLREAGAPEDRLCRVGDLILATAAHHGEDRGDTALMRDIDLAILGADAERFASYERQIRREHRWMPLFLYRHKRAEALSGFLARPRLFLSDWFHERYERQARHNLGVALTALRP